jgi:hypothetical protein
MTPIQAALQAVHPTDNTNHTYADHCAIARTQYMDYGLAFDNECPYCKGGVDHAHGHCGGCKEYFCTAHLVPLGEGGHCAACEALGAIQQAIGMRVHPACNDYYLKYYTKRPAWLTARLAPTLLKPGGMREYIAYCWTIGRDQCLLDLMVMGYSMCVVQPLIVAIHGQLDAGYAAHCAEAETSTDNDNLELF